MMCFDTGSNEAGHKPMKKAAKVTQKRTDIFDEQVGQRMAEVHTLNLAHEEMQNGRLLWEYANEFPGNTSPSTENTTVNKDPHGSVFGFLTDKMGKRHYSLLGGTLKGVEKAIIATSYLHFVSELQGKVELFAPDLRVYSTVVCNSTMIYRGTTWYKNGPWYDWVMVNWGEEEGVLPAKIWSFVDFRMAKPHNDGVNFGGIDIEPSIYAIVESAVFCNARRELLNSEIFRPITTEVGRFTDRRVSKLKFYLADVEAFHWPVVVVPDVDGDANRYLLVKNRGQWVEDFEKWLDRPYEHIPNE
jgi:hypothetical protein